MFCLEEVIEMLVIEYRTMIVFLNFSKTKKDLWSWRLISGTMLLFLYFMGGHILTEGAESSRVLPRVNTSGPPT